MRRTTLTLATATALAASGPALAEPSYDHVGLGVGLIEIDRGDRDGDGLVLDGQASIHPNFYLLGRFAGWGLDRGADRDDLRLGAGAHTELNRDVDVVGEVFYEDQELELRSGRDVDDDGFGLRGGVLAGVSPGVSVGGGVVYYDLDSDEDVAAYGEAWVDVASSVQVGGELELGDEQELITVGARLRF